MVSSLGASTENEDQEMQPARFSCYLLTSDPEDNEFQLDQAREEILNKKSKKPVLIFAHPSMWQGTNIWATWAPPTVLVLGFETLSTRKQIEGRFGRHTDEERMPMPEKRNNIQAGDIEVHYFESQMVRNAMTLPSSKTYQERLQQWTKNKLGEKLGYNKDDIKNTSKEQLVQDVLNTFDEDDDEDVDEETQQLVSKRKREMIEPFNTLHTNLSLKIEQMEVKMTKSEDASDEDDSYEATAQNDEYYEMMNQRARLQHHATHLSYNPLVTIDLIETTYTDIATDSDKCDKFEARYKKLTNKHLKSKVVEETHDDLDGFDLTLRAEAAASSQA